MIFAQPASTFIASYNPGISGLVGSLFSRLVNAANGTTVVARGSSGIIEYPAGSGIYLVTMTAPSNSGRYVIIVDNANTLPFACDDVTVALTVGVNGDPVATTIAPSYVGVFAPSGTLNLVVGDDYAVAESRQLVWVDTAGQWPTLTGAAIALLLNPRPAIDAHSLVAAGTVVSPTATKSVQVALTKAQTSTLTPGVPYVYGVVATLTNTDVVTLQQGNVNVLSQAD